MNSSAVMIALGHGLQHPCQSELEFIAPQKLRMFIVTHRLGQLFYACVGAGRQYIEHA
jgi:hypothetical protein